MNHVEPDSRKTHRTLCNNISRINNSLEVTEQIFEENLKDVHGGLLDIMRTISGTYSSDMIDEALRVFERPSRLNINDNDRINAIAEQIRMLLKQDLQSNSDHLAIFEEAEREAVNIVKEHT